MRYKILVFALLLSSLITAQTPGYMGKHCMIGYSNNFFVSALGANSKSTEVGLNSTHCFNFEYVIKNRTNLCLSFQTLKTGLAFDDDNLYYTSYDVTYNPKTDVPMQIRSNNVALGFKFFRKGTLAPVGKYRKVELALVFSTLTYGRNDFTYYDYNTSTTQRTNVGKGEYNFNSFKLSYAMGRQRVFFDRLVLDYGVEVSAFPGYVIGSLAGGIFDFGYGAGSEVEDEFQNQTTLRLFTHQLFNFHIGLGFLAF